jgi:hypothetical protein
LHGLESFCHNLFALRNMPFGRISFSVRTADTLSSGFRFNGLGDAGAALNRFIQRFSGTDKPLNPEFHTLAAPAVGLRCQPG